MTELRLGVEGSFRKIERLAGSLESLEASVKSLKEVLEELKERIDDLERCSRPPSLKGNHGVKSRIEVPGHLLPEMPKRAVPPGV